MLGITQKLERRPPAWFFVECDVFRSNAIITTMQGVQKSNFGLLQLLLNYLLPIICNLFSGLLYREQLPIHLDALRTVII
jgi:hypothetical protein